MVGYNLFQTSTLAMRSNAHALNTIGSNIANVSTGGFKRTDTKFETVLSQTVGVNQSDLGGVKPKDYQTITQQGVITPSTRDLDLAISGKGFYQLSNSLTSTNQENLFYSRDGSFRIGKSENTVSAVGEGGDTITVNEGYLVDKNGYYLLGWAPDADGTFSNTGAPAPMRIDTYAFATNFQETTIANLNLNLPSSAEIISDHAATVLAANAGTLNENMQTYTITVVDSNGTKRDATINFTKSANNQWEVSATTSRAATPQVDTLILQGTVEAGDTYSITVNNTTVSYTTTGAEADIAEIRTAVIAAINANAVVGNRVTATAGVASGEITLTENPGTTTAQVDTLTLAGTVEVGDVYQVNIDNISVSYTVASTDATLSDVRNGLLNAITANTGASALVTATASAAAGEITLTAVTSGTPFTSTGTSTNRALGTADNATAIVATTPQINTVTLAGTVEVGDVYQVTIGGIPVTYTVGETDATLSDVRNGLLTAITDNVGASALVTATAGAAAGEIALTSTALLSPVTTASATNVPLGTADNTLAATTTVGNDDGGSITTTALTVGAGAVAQVDTITLAGAVETGDIYSVTVNGTQISYTAAIGNTLSDVRNQLIANINGDATAGAIVAASAGAGGPGEIVLTASASGNTIATSATATNVLAGVDDNTATLVNTTAAVAVTDDDAIVAATNTNFQTSATQALNFTELGQVDGAAPVTLNFDFAFDDDATATVGLDVSDFTQYGDSFLPFSYNHNGQAVANLGRVTFDQVGHVLGNFDDGTQRTIYKLPLTTFTNPNGLDVLNGQVFQQSATSGDAISFAADASGLASFTPYALEISNVDIADEFTKMIMVQNAYNSNATVFKTVDEMVMVARDLKA